METARKNADSRPKTGPPMRRAITNTTTTVNVPAVATTARAEIIRSRNESSLAPPAAARAHDSRAWTAAKM